MEDLTDEGLRKGYTKEEWEIVGWEKERETNSLNEVQPETEELEIPEVPKTPKIPEVSKLDRLRLVMKKQFPKIKFEENLKFIEKFRRNPRCNVCNRYFLQSSINDVKAKVRRDKGTDLLPFALRIYKNSAEKLEDAKGYCRLVVSQGRDAKTIIPLPDMSLCSDFFLHPDINAYLVLVQRELLAKAKLEREAQAEINRDLKRKSDAEKLIIAINEKYKKRPGKPAKTPSVKPDIPKEVKEKGDQSDNSGRD